MSDEFSLFLFFYIFCIINILQPSFLTSVCYIPSNFFAFSEKMAAFSSSVSGS